MRVATYEDGRTQAAGPVERATILSLGRACPDQATDPLATVADLIGSVAVLASGDGGCGIDETGSQRRRLVEARN